MKLSTVSILFPIGVLSHYTFPNMIINGTTSAEWQYIRMTTNHQSSAPIESVSSPQIRCYESPSHKPAATASIAAGSTIGFKASNTMGHPGPMLVYMAKIPQGQSVASWKGDGNVWFKIYESGAKVENSMVVFKTGMNKVEAKVPKTLAGGEYLVRVEHIALHKAGVPQFYVACGQVKVTGGGSATGGSKVAFPGAYKKSDPSFTFNMYGNPVRPYPMPGPAVWTG